MDVAGSGVPPFSGRRVLRIGEGGRPEPFRDEPVAASGDVWARISKESTGLSPHQYVLRRRVERAKQLLSGTSLNLAEIALRCGFSNPSHFTQAFRQISGVTPTCWRSSARSGDQ